VADEPRQAPEPLTAEERTEKGPVLSVLSSLGFWLLIAFAILAFVIVWLFVVSGARRRDAALHRGEVIADARSKVNQCLLSRPELQKIDNFVSAVLLFHQASYENAEAVLAATPKDDPTYAARKANAARIKKTISPVAAIHFQVPTKKQCLALGATRYGLVKPTVPIRPVPKAKKRPTLPKKVTTTS
jgi:hypothetical protein